MSAVRSGGFRRGLLAGALIAVLVVLCPPAASALWSSSATAPAVPLSAGTVTTPTLATPPCVTRSVALLGSVADVSWNAVAGASAYRVTVRNQSGTLSGTSGPITGTTYTVSTTVLSGLLAGLLDLLLGGGTLYVSVQAEHASGWRSAPSGTVAVRPTTLLPIGVRCA